MSCIRRWWWVVPLVIFDVWLIGRWTGCGQPDSNEGTGCAARPTMEWKRKHEARGISLTFPTAQTNLWRTNDAEVFMPTASGRVSSALYGSVRTRMSNGRAMPAFHEGIDIAPLRRDGRGRAMDEVFSIAEGKVVYANGIGGASSYGKYVVVEHNAPIGPVYSLYSHLTEIEDAVKDNARVAAGQAIGRMGNSSTLGIPVSRSHLHLEICLMLNRRFSDWCRKNGMSTRHGNHHGWNLTGINPLAPYLRENTTEPFSVQQHLSAQPTAFLLTSRSARKPDYFEMYPALWRNGKGRFRAITLSFSGGGVITRGRPASSRELKLLGSRNWVIIEVNKAALGRNGPGLIAQNGGKWGLTRKGERTMEILSW